MTNAECRMMGSRDSLNGYIDRNAVECAVLSALPDRRYPLRTADATAVGGRTLRDMTKQECCRVRCPQRNVHRALSAGDSGRYSCGGRTLRDMMKQECCRVRCPQRNLHRALSAGDSGRYSCGGRTLRDMTKQECCRVRCPQRNAAPRIIRWGQRTLQLWGANASRYDEAGML